MTLGDIVKNYRDNHDLSMDAFANKSGLSKGYISMLEKNRNPKTGKPITPSLETIRTVAKAINIEIDALLKILDNEQDLMLNEVDPFQFDNIYPVETKKFPLLGEIACGEPIFANEDRESYIETGSDIKADFCLKAKGDSMTGARILDGDIVFIRKQDMVNNGEIAAVIIEDTATLKRVYYYKEKNLLILKPDNPSYSDQIYTNEELDQIKILGKAVAFQSDVI